MNIIIGTSIISNIANQVGQYNVNIVGVTKTMNLHIPEIFKRLSFTALTKVSANSIIKIWVIILKSR